MKCDDLFAYMKTAALMVKFLINNTHFLGLNCCLSSRKYFMLQSSDSQSVGSGPLVVCDGTVGGLFTTHRFYNCL